MPGNPRDVQSRRHNGSSHRMPGPQSSHYPRGTEETHTPQVRSDPWQSVSALQLGLKPRSFDKLHSERVYLLEMLNQHNGRATELFRLVPVIDEKIRQAQNSDDHRRAKKHRGWLRNRIVETVEEEKKILARLSELHVEIQCRERWCQVERERESRGHAQEQQHNTDYADWHLPLLPWYPPPYPPVVIYYPYYPTYGHADTPFAQGTYPEHNWDFQPHLHAQGSFEYSDGLDIPEKDGVPIDNGYGDAPRNTLDPPERTPTLRPQKRRSMPSLNSAPTGHDKENRESYVIF